METDESEQWMKIDSIAIELHIYIWKSKTKIETNQLWKY